jgi:hypothetical protein
MHVMYWRNKILTVDEILVFTYRQITKMQNGRLPIQKIFATIRVRFKTIRFLDMTFVLYRSVLAERKCIQQNCVCCFLAIWYRVAENDQIIG